MPDLYIIAGPNGSGKTTFALEYLPHYAKVREYVNADLIASGISPLDVDVAAIRAGEMMLRRIHELIAAGKPFAFETTLSGRMWIRLIQDAKAAGFAVTIFYLALPGPEVAVARIAERVRRGGHDIPRETVVRRFFRSQANFWGLYRGYADRWHLYDNSGDEPVLVARKARRGTMILRRELHRAFVEGCSHDGKAT